MQPFNFRDYGSHNFPKVYANGIPKTSVHSIINGILEHQAVFLETYPTSGLSSAAADETSNAVHDGAECALLCTVRGAAAGKVLTKTGSGSRALRSPLGGARKVPLVDVVATLLTSTWEEMDGTRHWAGASPVSESESAGTAGSSFTSLEVDQGSHIAIKGSRTGTSHPNINIDLEMAAFSCVDLPGVVDTPTTS